MATRRTLAADVRRRSGTEIGLAAVARESGEDMRVEIGVTIGDKVAGRQPHGLPRWRCRAPALGQCRHHGAWRRLGEARSADLR